MSSDNDDHAVTVRVPAIASGPRGLVGRTGRVNAVALVRDGTTIVTSCDAGKTICWNRADLAE